MMRIVRFSAPLKSTHINAMHIYTSDEYVPAVGRCGRSRTATCIPVLSRMPALSDLKCLHVRRSRGGRFTRPLKEGKQPCGCTVVVHRAVRGGGGEEVSKANEPVGVPILANTDNDDVDLRCLKHGQLHLQALVDANIHVLMS